MQSQQELREDFQIKMKFKELDRNKDGMLQLNEFADLLRQKGNHFDDREVRLLFDSVDRDKTGRINFDEFVDYIFGLKKPKKVSKNQAIAMEARQAALQMQQVEQVEIHGASFHQDLNGIFEQIGEVCNGYPLFERSYPQCIIFYGWTEHRHKVGWFAARVKPQSGPVQRYKMFNPSPHAKGPHLCSATWETPHGERDKKMLCVAVDSEPWDTECTEGTCLEEELWDGQGQQTEEDEDDGEWEVTPAADDEEQSWEREWWEEVGEGVEDFASEDVQASCYTGSGGGADAAEEQGAVEPFEDDDFPPGPMALGVSAAKLARAVVEVSPSHFVDDWTRLSEVHESPCLFRNVVPEDVLCETSTVNRWFLCACAVIAEYPAWIQSMFGRTTQLTPDGKYSVRLYHPGKRTFIKVTLDDHVPTKGKAPAYTGVTMEGEIWPALVEKAFAKLCGSYKNMEWGSTAYGMLYLCGGGGAESWARSPSGRWRRSYTVWRGKARNTIDRKRAEGVMADGVEIDSDRLWVVLREYMQFCYPVACTLDKSQEQASGLKSEWTFTFIAAREVQVQGKILRMVRMRNPFAAGQWRGRWSDFSEAWETCAVAVNTLKFKPKKDCTFWMAYSDFVRYFEGVDVVRKSLPVQGSRAAVVETMKRTLSQKQPQW